MDLSLPRGMRDLAPDEYEALERVRAAFTEVAGLFGFRLMEPSPIEMLQTLEAKSGAAVREEVYHFRDKGGRDVGLRFDLTVGLTRYVVSNRGLPLPVKVGAFSGMWRYDEPQHGRYRWFYQWDAEIFGASSADADAEIVEFTSTLFDRLGLKGASIEIGDRKVIEEFIRSRLGVSDYGKIMVLLRAVDKLERKTVDEVLKEYGEKGLDPETLSRLTEFGGLKGEPERIIGSLADRGLRQTEALIRLVDALKARRVPNVTLSMGVVRGLDYYTGIVFEVFGKEKRNLGALAGGGRYDALPEVFGRKDIGATGVAGGVERTILALSASEEAGVKSGRVFVGYVGEDLAGVSAGIASDLRRSGVPADLEVSGRSLRKQLEYASKDASLFVIVGPRDYAEGKVTLRDMKSGEESKIPLGDLESRIRSSL